MRTLFVAEPPRPWTERPKLVVDASLLAATLFSEPARGQADTQVRGRALHAPSLIDYELASVALNKIRSKAVSADDARRILGIYVQLEIERWDVDIASVIRISENFGMTAYDAAYLWVAGRLRAPIATFDARLAAAAAVYLKQLPPMS